MEIENKEYKSDEVTSILESVEMKPRPGGGYTIDTRDIEDQEKKGFLLEMSDILGINGKDNELDSYNAFLRENSRKARIEECRLLAKKKEKDARKRREAKRSKKINRK